MTQEGFVAFSALSAGSRWSPPAAEAPAFRGLAAEWAEAVQPYTEAAPIGILAATLVAFGNAVGRGPHVHVGATRHGVNEDLVLIGPTASGRKGEAMNAGLLPIRRADKDWAVRVCRGFGSGEAVIASVADVPEGDQDPDSPPTHGDPRLLVHEDEFAQLLAVVVRQGSSLSSTLRSAWDGGKLENRTRGSGALVATAPHVSVLAAITPDELSRQVPATEIANGLLNRFLLVAVSRDQMLPDGPAIPQQLIDDYSERFEMALLTAGRVGLMTRGPAAAEVWRSAYQHELSIDRAGLAGAVCSRAEAHALRLSMLYALLDSEVGPSDVVQEPHIESALALWRYCEQSATIVFGDRLGDPDADLILDELGKAPNQELTRTELRDIFSRHRSRASLDGTLARLLRAGQIEVDKEQTGGRPTTRYRLARRDRSDESAQT